MSAVVAPLDQRRRARPPADRVAQRDDQATYRRGQVNHCPGCGRSNWHVGRVSAECAFCATALPFATPASGKDA